MRRFLLIVPALLLASGCSDATGPTVEAPYSLLSVFGGNGLPYTLPGATGCVGPDGEIYDEGQKTSKLVDGTFRFNRGSQSYSLIMEGRSQCVTPAGDSTEWTPYTHTTEGPFERDPETERILLWVGEPPADTTPNNYFVDISRDTLYLHEPLYNNRRATFVR